MPRKTAAMRRIEETFEVRDVERELRRRYLGEEESAARIARSWGIDAPTVWRWLKLFDIPTRPVGARTGTDEP